MGINNMDKIKKYLILNKIHPSFQRIKILQYLLQYPNHPTVDMIYNEISKEIPTLSKTTIYSTLKYFLNKGIVKALTIDENEIRYDTNTKPHVHFKCIECKNVYDLETESDCFKQTMVEGHKILEHHIYLKGICKVCLK